MIEQELMDVVQDTSENTSFLKKDTVFAFMIFKLESGVFKLLKEKPLSPTGKGKILTQILCMYILKIYNSWLAKHSFLITYYIYLSGKIDPQQIVGAHCFYLPVDKLKYTVTINTCTCISAQ